ncbi:ATP-binding protein [Clostridium sp. SHJSY1]|uniref:sensor histidine kinase n=1 Tax=Clostridium sp. SHJSY1 TaxID=2942483 RepID=UPI002874C29C|nr:HAMP domain-containing sensor histidine kinase [Clostridium sp. SHJSY1]MDS0526090.1 ATP-binding protein [Clostridium sp. SHJSY1]
MAIKLKNKYTIVIVFLISAYICGISVLSVSDLIKNREYLKVDSYFECSQFKRDLGSYFNNIRYLDEVYKDYSLKSDDDKVTKSELTLSKTLYETNLSRWEDEIIDKYKYQILNSAQAQNSNETNRLTEERDKELNEIKIKNSKTVEDLKKEIVTYKDKDYENIKNAIEAKSTIKYYIENEENGSVNTNIENLSDIDEYINKNALYSIKLPYECKDSDRMKYISIWAELTNKKVCFVVPNSIDENSPIYKNYNYYNSVRERLFKEIIIGIISFLIGLPLLIFILKKSNVDETRLIKWYKKIPLDLKMIIFAIYPIIVVWYMNKILFFVKQYRISQIFIITVVAIYVLYLAINIKLIINLITSKEKFKLEVKKCLSNRMLNYFRDKSAFQSIKFKTLMLIIFALSLGVSMFVIFIGIASRKIPMIIIGIGYMLFYMLFVIWYIIKTNRFFLRIIEGTDEIVAGNLNCTIEEKGIGEFLKIVNNINNMKTGFKKALENEIKSERLKSELITNVSHDLKTPLTSIINYVGLLKKEGISNEEADRYIDVLDRKSQRLKVIIDDLFEASKMASGAVDLEVEKIEVTSLLKQTLGEFDEAINNSELTFRLKFPEEKVYANLDGKKTWRVFENLINNILKYSQSGTRVYISLKEEDNKIIITMKNISSYEMDFQNEEIFERFKRGDKSRSTEGTGLGLSIAKSIVELQGGELSIEIDGDLFKTRVIVPSANY